MATVGVKGLKCTNFTKSLFITICTHQSDLTSIVRFLRTAPYRVIIERNVKNRPFSLPLHQTPPWATCAWRIPAHTRSLVGGTSSSYYCDRRRRCRRVYKRRGRPRCEVPCSRSPRSSHDSPDTRRQRLGISSRDTPADSTDHPGRFYTGCSEPPSDTNITLQSSTFNCRSKLVQCLEDS